VRACDIVAIDDIFVVNGDSLSPMANQPPSPMVQPPAIVATIGDNGDRQCLPLSSFSLN
jgi:hypothetical protein